MSLYLIIFIFLSSSILANIPTPHKIQGEPTDYSYDAVGNFKTLTHTNGEGGEGVW